MANRVFKYPVPLHSTFEVVLPAAREFLSMQVQTGQPQMWFSVDDTAPPEQTVGFALVATGEVVPELAVYRGTFQLAGGSIVMHLYEVGS